MITADDLDRLCVLTYRVVQGDTHTFNNDDWDFLDEVAVHAEDVISLTYNDNDDEPDLDNWEDSLFDEDEDSEDLEDLDEVE